ncbi:glutamate receptor ionotropic, kainate 2-like isoform X1 [Schistocerca nitens]|uniref:glutamate receptor ionotropic, kainate 2-like isoform X1 n=1 Tax=Schistocerca nitens TaxID=7011 RepID=UPI002118E30A|nr:glutamate receptor ionotropic, kainate 2-like isoform X1 [Schistocerca nitens]
MAGGLRHRLRLLPWLVVVAASCLLGAHASNNPTYSVRIAGIFEETDPPALQHAFLSAVEAVNRQTTMEFVLGNAGHRPLLRSHVEVLNAADSYSAKRRACSLVEEGVAGVVGPRQSASTDVVRSMCDRLEIPQIIVNWDPYPPPIASYQFNLHPHADFISQALVDVLHELKWRSYTVLYQGDESLVRLRGVLQEREPRDPPIAVRQLDEDGDNRPLLKEIKQAAESRLVLDCDTDLIMPVLRQAADIKLTEVYQSYLLTSLDAHTMDFTQFRLSGTNITILRLIQPESEAVMKTIQDFEYPGTEVADTITPQTIRTETALMYDAVRVLAEALFKTSTMNWVQEQPLNCSDDTAVWDRGISVREFIKDMRHEGISGEIKFDARGRRMGFELEVLELSAAGFKRVGTWTPEEGFLGTRTETQTLEETQNIIQGRHLIVSSRLGPPYLREKLPTSPPRVGNDRYEGYSMDLIAQIAEILNFTFEFKLAPDGKYGGVDEKTGNWNGLVGELMAGRADLAICDLTITQERQSAVDFTMPFMTLGISILYKQPEKADPNLFSFLDPFTIDVWIYMATAYLGVSVIFFILARMAPGEWDKSHPCDPDPTELENTFNMINIFWFSTGSLMGQGCDLLPKAVSTRLIAGMWWFFTLIMIASYTANLAAFLTNSKLDAPIEGVEDLAKQTKIKYGTYGGGSTAGFFKNSNDSLYQRMWLVMKQARPDVFTADNQEGVERVKKEKGNYAFFMESTSIEYQTALNCDLRKIGGLLDSKGYGIALPRDSPFRTAVSGAVLQLQERGNLSALKTRWWKAPEGKECPSDVNTVDSAELGILNVGGVFLVLAFGTLGAFFVAILELLWNCRKIAVEEKITPWEALTSELKFVVQCSNDEKPVRKPPDPEGDKDEEASHLHYGRLSADK